MIRLLFYFLLGYVLWRIIQTVLRIVSHSSHGNEWPEQPPQGPKQTPPPTGFSDVKDARFEDIPPGKPKDDNTTPSS